MDANKIPDIVVSRLPIYLRALNHLAEDGQEVISSQALGELLSISSAQIRKDLSHFGEFGKQGSGYRVDYLRSQLRRILKLEIVWPVVLVGCGALGRALVNYPDFQSEGFKIQALFDNSPQKIGDVVAGMCVQDVEELSQTVQEGNFRVAILAVPVATAQQTADKLVEAGIRAILNYAPINISVPKEVIVQHIDPTVYLQWMSYYL
jgi:redox-sensing transcriptional repressor